MWTAQSLEYREDGKLYVVGWGNFFKLMEKMNAYINGWVKTHVAMNAPGKRIFTKEVKVGNCSKPADFLKICGTMEPQYLDIITQKTGLRKGENPKAEFYGWEYSPKWMVEAGYCSPSDKLFLHKHIGAKRLTYGLKSDFDWGTA